MSLDTALSKLTPVSRGMGILKVVTAERIQGIQDALVALTRGGNLRSGPGIMIDTAPSGVVIKAYSDPSSTRSYPAHPFEVVPVAVKGAAKGSVNLQVEMDSWLMKSEKWNDKMTITGLGEPFELSEDDLAIWLEITLDGEGAVTKATIEHGKPGNTGDWRDFPDPFHYDDEENQDKYFQLLAYIDPVTENPYRPGGIPISGKSPRRLVQCTYVNLIVAEKCLVEDGRTVRVLAPWHAPYVAGGK